jgi:putative endonuclease
VKSEYIYVYIMASYSRVLYIGVSSEINIRVQQHKDGTFENSFTRRYKIDKLVYFERFTDPGPAIAREKQLKRWTRWKKICLIDANNPVWRDLSEDWGDPRDIYKPERPDSSTRRSRTLAARSE